MVKFDLVVSLVYFKLYIKIDGFGLTFPIP